MPINLDRFIEAQQNDYANALNEIKNGKKQSHWMWYIFPQVIGLGMSETSIKYAINNLNEASAFLHHPILGKRLIEITNVVLQLPENDAYKIFGNPDEQKLKSSMTLFALLAETDLVFERVLTKFYCGDKDKKTIEIVNRWKKIS